MSPSAWLVVLIFCLVATSALLGRTRQKLRRLRFAQLSEAELLRRHLDQQSLDVELRPNDLSYLRSETVFVIGAGGTIATELVLQLGSAGCRKIVLIDNNENGLYSLLEKVRLRHEHLLEILEIELANTRDVARVDTLFELHQPGVVFHYANYKSAALSTMTPYGFVMVNVGGISNVLASVDACPSMRTFVYISSDKAQDASQVYGKTKRISELLVTAHAMRNGRVNFVSMRYCNVLDAAGSFAIPTFRRQILAGAPVTVRRLEDGSVPERHFMPISTAARVAIRAGSLAERGNVLSLDEKKVRPLAIDDLAIELARAAGIRRLHSWSRRSIQYITAHTGEKHTENLGAGVCVPRAPMVMLPPTTLDAPEAFVHRVNQLIEHVGERGDMNLPREVDEVLAAGLVATTHSNPVVASPTAALLEKPRISLDQTHA